MSEKKKSKGRIIAAVVMAVTAVVGVVWVALSWDGLTSMSAEEWRLWGETVKDVIENRVAPAMVLVLSGCLMLWAAISPVCAKLRVQVETSRAEAEKHAKGYDDVKRRSDAADALILELRAEREEMRAERERMAEESLRREKARDEALHDWLEAHGAQLDRIEADGRANREMAVIGFSHSEELVRGRWAAQIRRIGDGKEEVTTDGGAQEKDTEADAG